MLVVASLYAVYSYFWGVVLHLVYYAADHVWNKSLTSRFDGGKVGDSFLWPFRLFGKIVNITKETLK